MSNVDVDVAVFPYVSVPVSTRVWEPELRVLKSISREAGPVHVYGEIREIYF